MPYSLLTNHYEKEHHCAKGNYMSILLKKLESIETSQGAGRPGVV